MSNADILRGNSQRGATVSRPWTENTAGSSMSWLRSTAWRAWATTASPNAMWSSQPKSRTSFYLFIYLFWMKLHSNHKCGPQGKGSLSKLSADIADWARDIHEGPASHRSHQTAEQQVSILSSTNFSQTGHTLIQLKYVFCIFSCLSMTIWFWFFF